jgi:hypothetical protein
MNQWIVPLPQCQGLIAANNMQPTVMGWPNGALEQYESRIPYSPGQRMHLRRYSNVCVCEIEPAPETDPAYHLKDDIAPAALSGLVGAGLGALVDQRRASRGAIAGGLLGVVSYAAFRWLSA